MIRHHRRLVAIALTAATLPLLAGCFNGQAATTTVQATQPTGNGTNATVGQIRIENATLVRDEAGTAVTLIMTVVNLGDEADTLDFAEIGGQQAVITDGTGTVPVVELPAGEPVSFGYGQLGAPATLWANAYALQAPSSGYVDVTLLFRNAGAATMSVLTVPPVGYYAGIAPQPSTPPAQ